MSKIKVGDRVAGFRFESREEGPAWVLAKGAWKFYRVANEPLEL